MIPMHYIPGERPVNRQDVVFTARLIGQATGGRAGTIVLVASILLSALSAVAIYAAELMARRAFSEYRVGIYRDLKYTRSTFHSYLLMDYGSSATLFISFVMEHTFMLLIIGAEVLGTENAGPRIRWIRHFWFILSSYWISFLAVEISLIITIKGLHRKVSLDIPYYFALVLDIIAIILMMISHLIAVKIQRAILIRDRIMALPELTVESHDYDDCVICLQAQPVITILRQLPCQHTFHNTCIQRWLIKKPTCPICKGRI